MARDRPASRTGEEPAATRLPPFERVVERHGPTVLRFCAARVGADRAEDCFQETMLSALRAYDTLRDAGATRSWLLSIAARKAIDAHRARAGAPEPVGDPAILDAPSHDAAPDRRLAGAALWASVRELPAKQREAVALRFAGELTHREIAEAMQISEAAARRNVFEGVSRLRALVAEDDAR